MWYPERERKFNVLEEKKEKLEKEKNSLSTEEIQNIKKDFFDKYIKNGELKEQMKGINSIILKNLLKGS